MHFMFAFRVSTSGAHAPKHEAQRAVGKLLWQQQHAIDVQTDLVPIVFQVCNGSVCHHRLPYRITLAMILPPDPPPVRLPPDLGELGRAELPAGEATAAVERAAPAAAPLLGVVPEEEAPRKSSTLMMGVGVVMVSITGADWAMKIRM